MFFSVQVIHFWSLWRRVLNCQCFVSFSCGLWHILDPSLFSPQFEISFLASTLPQRPILIKLLGIEESQLGILLKLPNAEPGLCWTYSGLAMKKHIIGLFFSPILHIFYNINYNSSSVYHKACVNLSILEADFQAAGLTDVY